MRTFYAIVVCFILGVPALNASATRQQVTVVLADTQGSAYDQTSVYFDLGTSTTYIYPEDVQKTFDTSASALQIFSYSSDGVKCYSNGYGHFTSTVVIPIGVKVPGGSYVFSASVLANFDPNTLILFEDRATGTYTDMRQSIYTIHISGDEVDSARFYLHITYPPVISSVISGCNNNDGSIIITEDSSVTWTSCTLFDSAMTRIAGYSNITGNTRFTALAAGVYYVGFTYGTYTTNQSINIQTSQVVAGVSASATHVAVKQNIAFGAVANNATGYEWDFGDGTLITGVAHLEYFYYEPGVYNVTLKCSNTYGCAAYAYTTIYVSVSTDVQSLNSYNLSVIPDNGSVVIRISEPVKSGCTYQIVDVAGKQIASGSITAQENTVNLACHSAGVYIVTVKDAATFVSKKIYLP
jgi:PKD repeat protein